MSKTERQKQEKEIWDKFIQPLIEEYGLNHLTYKYMDWDSKWVDIKSIDSLKHREGLLALRLVHGHQPFETSFMRNDETYHHGTLDLIEWLRNKAHEEKKLPYFERSDGRIDHPRILPKDVLPIFKTHMRLHFREGTIPYLLDQLALQYNFSPDIIYQDEKEPQKSIDLKIKEYLKDPELIELLKKARFETDVINDDKNDIIKELKPSGYNLADMEKNLKEKIITVFEDRTEHQKFEFMKKKYLEDPKLYKEDPAHPKRYFVGNLLKKIAKDKEHYPKGIKGKGNYEKLYELSE